jgi:IS5 family transposase
MDRQLQPVAVRQRRDDGYGRGFRKLVKWRTGCEGRISYLKRGYGWDRARLDGQAGAAIWCGHGVFATT